MKWYLNGKVFDERLAKQKWGNDNNRLFLSSKGNYFHWLTGEKHILTKVEAAGWFLVNNIDLPEDLTIIAKDMLE